MPYEIKRKIGDDGELEELVSWQSTKPKRSDSWWIKLTRRPTLVIFIVLQMGCLSVGIVLVVLAALLVLHFTQAPLPSVPKPLPDNAVDRPCNPAVLQSSTTYVAFISDRQAQYGMAYLTNPDQPDSTCGFLTNTQGVTSVSWSPDHRIAFTGSRGLWIADAQGASQQLIVEGVISNEPVDRSPDGTRLLFVSAKDAGTNIGSVGSAGENIHILTTDHSHNRAPRWSPDGTRIVFVSDRDGHDQLYIMDADGTNSHRLIESPANDDHPAWSPDGTQIIFDSDRGNNRNLYLIGADGAGLGRLTNTTARDERPVWSPDGRQIAFVSYRDGNDEIYVMNADGTNSRRYTANLNNDSMPTWTR